MPSESDRPDTVSTNPRAWLEQNVARVSLVVGGIARRRRLRDQDRDELLSLVWTHLARDDYRVLRRYRGSSGIMTYLTVVAERLLLDLRTTIWGKWRPSAYARRLGSRAVLFERLVVRDGVPVPQAREAVLQATGQAIPIATETELAARGPRQRRQFVPLREAVSYAAPSVDPWTALVDQHYAQSGAAIGRLLERVLRQLPAEDQVLLRMRHEQGLQVRQIALMLGLDDKKLYRRLAAIHREMRQALTRMGVSAREATEVACGRLSHVPRILDRLDQAS